MSALDQRFIVGDRVRVRGNQHVKEQEAAYVDDTDIGSTAPYHVRQGDKGSWVWEDEGQTIEPWHDYHNPPIPDIPAGAQVIHLLPTDVILIGNVGHMDTDNLPNVSALLGGRKVVLFENDINVKLLREVEQGEAA